MLSSTDWPLGAKRGATPLREVGPHPADGAPIQLFEGRYGPYVKHGSVNASLPKGADADTLARFDYVIGSVHYVDDFPVDEKHPLWAALSALAQGSVSRTQIKVSTSASMTTAMPKTTRS